MDFQQYLSFLGRARLNFEAVEALKAMLIDAGYRAFSEGDRWSLSAGDRGFVVKNGTGILAFRIGKKPSAGFSIVGSHSDSPGFRIKPSPDMRRAEVQCLNTEVYGGPLLSTWFDRPLSIGGKVTVATDDPLRPQVRFYTSEPGAVFIPSVAIHMNRDANKGVEINPQEHTLPVISTREDFRLLPEIERTIGAKVLSHELYLISDAAPQVVGWDREFYMSGRIDNLGCAYANIAALIESDDSDRTAVAFISDNEEIGSMTKQGANSPFLRDCLLRIVESQGGDFQDYRMALAESFMISSDQAHAVHPNYAGFADPTNQPRINGGVVIKVAANGAYTSDAVSIAVFRAFAEKAGAPTQTFVNRSDKRGGSTIAAITTSHIDIPIVDVGNPMWGMHSAVETAGVRDQESMANIMRLFLSTSDLPRA